MVTSVGHASSLVVPCGDIFLKSSKSCDFIEGSPFIAEVVGEVAPDYVNEPKPVPFDRQLEG